MSTYHFSPASTHRKSAGLVISVLLLGSAIPASARHVEKRFKVDAHPVITIHNPNGTVIVKAWTKHEVMVLADHASSSIEVEVLQTGNRIDVTTRPLASDVSPEDVLANFQINVPEDAELQIHNDSGTVSVDNVLGDTNVETVGADVGLEDAAGYLTVKTVGGSFQCLRCAGRIEVSSISGNFRLIDSRSYHIVAQTSTGNILFDGEFLPNGTYHLKNYSGLIEVRFSQDDSFDLSATSLKGKVNNEAKLTPGPRPQYSAPRFGDSLFGKLNTGRAKVDLTSFDGTINILKRN